MKYSPSSSLKKLLIEHNQLKWHDTKKWLKKKVQFDKFKEPEPGQEDATIDKLKPRVKKQYLMSEQEIKQNEIIEAIFVKFDVDGSGSLDLGELIDLFKQNKVRLEKDTIRQMFQGDEFTLQKFKAIINSVELL